MLRAQSAPTGRRPAAHGPVPGPVSTLGGTAEGSLPRGKGVQITSKGRKEGKERHRERLLVMEKRYSKEDRKAKRTVRQTEKTATDGRRGRAELQLEKPGDQSRAGEPENQEKRERERGKRGEGGERKAAGEPEPDQSREGSEREALIMDVGGSAGQPV